MDFNTNEYRFFYYVVYSTPTSRGAINVSTESLIKTFDDIMSLRNYIQNQLDCEGVLVEDWKQIEAQVF